MTPVPGGFGNSWYREAKEAGDPVVIARPSIPVGRGDRHPGQDLGLPEMRSCRESIVESVRWCQASGHIRPNNG
jgi:hypothetical protein